MSESVLTSEPELSASFTGEQVRPGDHEFDALRRIYNAGTDRRPRLILRPHDAADVIDAVRYAQEADLPLSVRCGGHGIAGTAVCEGGVLVDLRAMKGVHVDARRRVAVAQGGVLWAEYDRDTTLHGLATPGGRVTTTGLGGFTLGGGYGWMSPVHGLACDNLVGADLVTADGRLVHVSEDEHPDLLWGLRGAGANFGVVTAYEMRLHPIAPLLYAGMMVVPNSAESGDLVRAYRQIAEQGPEALSTALATVLAPPEPFVPPELVGQPMVGIVAAWFGDRADAEEAVRPLRELTAGGVDLVQDMPYTAFQAMLDGFAPPGWLNYHRGMHLTALTDDSIDAYLEVGRSIRSPMDQGIIFHNGGAISRVPEDATAAGNRAAPYMAHPIACWSDPAETEREMDWVRRFTEAFASARTGGVYLNFEPGTTFSDVKAGFGEEKYRRLVALKDEWDPQNLFRSNHNIAPSGWGPTTSVPRQPTG